jgi:MFS family permease
VTYGEVLANRHYRHILLAQFLSNVGTWMEMFVIQSFVATKSSSLADAGTLAAFQQVPVFVLGLVGGLAADRVNRRTMLVVTQVLAGLVAVGVAGVTWLDGRGGFEHPRMAIWLLWGLGALNGCVMAFNFPAWQVLTPRLVQRRQLTRAVTLNGIQFNLARMIGPAFSGLLLAMVAAPPLLLFNAVTFVVMAAVVMTTPDAPAPTHAVGPRATPVRELLDAAGTLWKHPGMRAVFYAQVLASLLAAPLVRLIAQYMRDVYGLDAKSADKLGGLMLAVQGLGAVCGGLMLRFIPAWYPKHHFIPVAITALGLSIAMFGLTSTLAAGYAAMAVCGFFWIWAFNQSWAAMQMLAPDAMRGRLLAIVTVAGFGATAAGAFGAGLFGEQVKDAGWLSAQGATQLTVVLLGAPLLAAGLVMMIYRVPEVDGLPRRTPGAGSRARPDRSLWNAITARAHKPKNEVEPAEVP